MANNDQPTETRSVESEIASAFQSARENVVQKAESYRGLVQEKPGTSLLYAVGIGYLLRSLPIFGLLSIVISVLTSLVRPAVLIYAATKLYELVQRQGGSDRQS